MRKWLTIAKWRHVFSKVLRLLFSSRVALKDKLLFLIPVIVYWVLPDAIPFFPLDDVAVTMLLSAWFAERIEKKQKPSMK